MNTRLAKAAAAVGLLSIAFLCAGWGKRERTSLELLQIVAFGCGLTLDASEFSQMDLRKLAAAAKQGQSTLHLRNCGGIATTNLLVIGQLAGGHVEIEF